MAIELSKGAKILAGSVVVLAAAGAGAWFFLFDDEAPPPRVVVVTPAGAPKPAADAAKPADAAAPAEASKPADAAKPAEPAKAAEPAQAAAAPKTAVAAKPAAPAPARPIPTDPDKLIAEVIETSAIKTSFQAFGGEIARQAVAADQPPGLSVDDERTLADALQRAYEPGKLTGEIAANLKKTGLDAERMARYLEIQRQPIAQKMVAEGAREVGQAEALKEFTEAQRKTPPTTERSKLIQSLDNVTRNSEIRTEMAGAMVREMLDVILAGTQKAGSKVPKELRASVTTQLNAIRVNARSQAIALLHYQYRNVPDEEIAAYVKLLDTDTGRWGTDLLNGAIRPLLTNRFGTLGKDLAQLALSKRMGTLAKAPPGPEPLPKAQSEAPAEAPITKSTGGTAAVPAEIPGYRRPANVRPLYTRYNDLITATVMRDATAVRELLADGKPVDARQADGATPLMIAVGNGDADIAAMLLKRGADPNARAVGGATPLSIARTRGSAGAGLVQMLQASGAKQ